MVENFENFSKAPSIYALDDFVTIGDLSAYFIPIEMPNLVYLLLFSHSFGFFLRFDSPFPDIVYIPILFYFLLLGSIEEMREHFCDLIRSIRGVIRVPSGL